LQESRRLPAAELREEMLARLAGAVARLQRPPGLAVVLVGEDPASRVYVAGKEKACRRVGFRHETFRLPAATSEAELLALIARLNGDPAWDGILVQMPLPPQLDAARIQQAVSPLKDVDGFHPQNLGLLAAGRPRFVPCTPRGIVALLAHHGIGIAGRRVAIVGRSLIVGLPLLLLMTRKAADGNATVTLCHSATRDLATVTREAEIVVAAVGRPATLTREHIAAGTVVVDVGVNRVDDPQAKRGYRLAGDVAQEALAGWASAYTPVPGGVGPMTITMLMQNTWEAWRRLHDAESDD